MNIKNKIQNLNPWFLVIIPLLTSFITRVYKLLDKSLWFDETSRYFVAKFSVSDIIYIAKTSSFSSPLHNLILHYWHLFGDSEFWIRLFPLIFGLISVVIFFVVVQKVFFDENQPKKSFFIACLASIFLAISPMHIHYSQDAGGPYTLFFLLFIISFYLFDRIIEDYKKIKFRYFLYFALILSFSFYLHYSTIHIVIAYNLIFILFHLMYLGRGFGKIEWFKNLKKWVYCQLILLISVLPIIPLVLWQSSRGQPGPTVKFTHLKELFLVFNFGQWNFDEKTLFGIIFFVIFVITLLVIIKNRKQKSFRKDLLVFLCFIVPIIVGFVIGLKTHAFRPRYAFPLLAMYLVLWARGIYLVKNSFVKIILILVFIGISSFSLNQYYNVQPYWEKEPWRETVEFINNNSLPNDIIIFPVSNEQMAFDYYHLKTENQLERHGLIRDLDFPRGQGLIFDFSSKTPEDLITQFEDLTKNHDRVWLVSARFTIGAPGQKSIGHIVREHMVDNKDAYQPVLAKHLGGRMNVFLYNKLK